MKLQYHFTIGLLIILVTQFLFLGSVLAPSPVTNLTMMEDMIPSNDNSKIIPSQNNKSDFLTLDGIYYYTTIIAGERVIIKQNTDGEILSQIEMGFGIFGGMEVLNQSTVISTPFAGSLVAWDQDKNITTPLPITTHHNFVYNHQKNTYLTLQYERLDTTDPAIYDSVIEYSSSGEKLWEFNFSDIVGLELWSGDMNNQYKDITHANSLDWDVTSGKIWVHMRNTDQIYQIDYSTKSIDWILGNQGNFTLKNFEGQSVTSLFHRAHDLHMLDSNNLILFDNQYEMPSTGEMRSRLIQIHFDPVSYQSSVVKQWIAPSSLYSSIWGSVEKLPNGNFLGSFGFSGNPSIVEVNMTSQEFSIKEMPGTFFNVGFHQIHPTIDLPDNSKHLSDTNIEINTPIFASYDWYFEETMDYSIYLNDALVETSSINLLSDWQKTNLAVLLSPLPTGDYTLKIVTNSIFNQSNIYEVTLIIRDYFFTSPVNSVFEDGQSVEMKFSGIFKYPVSLLLEAQGMVYYNQTWAGSSILLNNTFTPANYYLEYQLSNSSEVLETGQISLVIEEQRAPLYTLNSSLTFEWGSPIEIQLSINETSSFDISLEVDGITWFDEAYPLSDESVVIRLPQLSETVHQFDLIITDEFSLTTQDEIVISIVSPTVPVIVSTLPTFLDWGKLDQLIWEIHGADEIELYRNDELLQSSSLSLLQFTHNLDWRGDNWQLTSYNLTIVASNDNYSATFTEFVNVDVLEIDRYGSSIIQSQTSWVINPQLATGSPDQQNAEIEFGYENGQVMIDMNANIINTDGDDLIIHASGGTYRVLISNDQNSGFFNLGNGQGESTFDITPVDQAQFVIVEYITGAPVLLDAVEAVSIAETSTNQNYSLNLPDVFLDDSQSSYELYWNISDYLGVNYSIEVNGESVIERAWNGTSIYYQLDLSQFTSTYVVEITTLNILGVIQNGTVVITVEQTNTGFLLLLGSILLLGPVAVFVYRKYSKNR